MIYEIEISEQAELDLRNIFKYIAFTLLSMENAIGQLGRLEESIQMALRSTSSAVLFCLQCANC